MTKASAEYAPRTDSPRVRVPLLLALTALTGACPSPRYGRASENTGYGIVSTDEMVKMCMRSPGTAAT